MKKGLQTLVEEATYYVEHVHHALKRIAQALEDSYRASRDDDSSECWWTCERCDCSTNWYLVDSCKVCGEDKP